MVRLKAGVGKEKLPQLVHFNSNMVRLKVVYFRILKPQKPNFNSNMVRLKVAREDFIRQYINDISIPILCD